MFSHFYRLVSHVFVNRHRSRKRAKPSDEIKPQNKKAKTEDDKLDEKLKVDLFSWIQQLRVICSETKPVIVGCPRQTEQGRVEKRLDPAVAI